jgi:hypothetical protein
MLVQDSKSHLEAQRSTVSLSVNQRFVATLVFLIAALACLGIDWRLRVLAADDSYIHLRIARHLMQAGQAFFNLNERVMVSSSPLWSVLLGLSGIFCKTFPPALPLEALSLGGACMLGFLLAVNFSSEASLNRVARAFYVALVPSMIFLLLLKTSILQMETPLAIALLLAGVYLWQRHSAWWLGVVVLSAWVRYEYFVLAAMLFTMAVLTKRLNVKAVLAAVAAFASGAVWLEYQFGTLLPNTAKAKSAAYSLTYLESFHSLGGLGYIKVALLGAIFVAIFVSRSIRRISIPDVLLIGGVVIDVLYVTKKTLIFPWYLPLAVTPIVLGLLFGVGIWGRGWIRILVFVTALLFLPMRHTLYYEAVASGENKPWRDQADNFEIRTREYILVGRAIDSVCPRAKLMTSEIGGLGEGFPGEILDGLGLATPAATKYHPMRVPEERSSGRIGAIPVGFVAEMKPDVIVSYGISSEAVRKYYDPSVYSISEYPPLPAIEGQSYNDLGLGDLYLLVAKHGACSASSIDAAVRAAVATE